MLLLAGLGKLLGSLLAVACYDTTAPCNEKLWPLLCCHICNCVSCRVTDDQSFIIFQQALAAKRSPHRKFQMAAGAVHRSPLLAKVALATATAASSTVMVCPSTVRTTAPGSRPL
jgi:hypothetical protein